MNFRLTLLMKNHQVSLFYCQICVTVGLAAKALVALRELPQTNLGLLALFEQARRELTVSEPDFRRTSRSVTLGMTLTYLWQLWQAS
jgi:hypothetical protein